MTAYHSSRNKMTADLAYLTYWNSYDFHMFPRCHRACDRAAISRRLILFSAYLRPLHPLQLIFYYWYDRRPVANQSSTSRPTFGDLFSFSR